jgi:ADP-ribose pyrophosphatase YjhB (NUDIX family)
LPGIRDWSKLDPAMSESNPNQAGNFVSAVPEGDNRARQVCADCGFISYENPKIVVGSVVHSDGRVLMCRRAINPRKGHWTLPAGYLELHEMTEAGAMREAWEEARAKIEIETLLAVYTIPRLSQVQIIYRARLSDAKIEAGPESLEVALFEFEDIPWNDIAFPSVTWALRHYRDSRERAAFAPFANPPGEMGNF